MTDLTTLQNDYQAACKSFSEAADTLSQAATTLLAETVREHFPTATGLRVETGWDESWWFSLQAVIVPDGEIAAHDENERLVSDVMADIDETLAELRYDIFPTHEPEEKEEITWA